VPSLYKLLKMPQVNGMNKLPQIEKRSRSGVSDDYGKYVGYLDILVLFYMSNFFFFVSEALLSKMIKTVAIQCPIDEFSRLCAKLRLPPEFLDQVTSDKTMTEDQQLVILLWKWRNR